MAHVKHTFNSSVVNALCCSLGSTFVTLKYFRLHFRSSSHQQDGNGKTSLISFKQRLNSTVLNPGPGARGRVRTEGHVRKIYLRKNNGQRKEVQKTAD